MSTLLSQRKSSAATFLFLFLVFYSNPLDVVAQNGRFDVSGVVTDSAGVGLQGATVVALTRADSVLTKFATSSSDGSFTLRRVPEGDYILQITFVGFQTWRKDITVSEQDFDAGTATLDISVAELDELVVSAEHIPIVIKKDTLEYNAAAFATRPNAVVEDLLRRLPGVEVDADGNIKAQGEDVQQVLVDGKEFFGNDPKMATKNLPANAIDKVQVYDKKSDMAEFTGVDDGEETKTINLELKEEAKKGYFGNMSGGYAAEGRYDGQASINRFSSNTQLAFIGNLNNINRQGFSFGDYLSFMGGMSAVMGDRGSFSTGGIPISSDLSDGFSETLALGLNVGHDFGSKTEIRSSYFISNIENNQVRSTQQQQVLGSALSALTLQNTTQNSDNLAHRMSLTAKHEFQKGNELQLRSNFSLSTSSLDNLGARETTSFEGFTQNNATTNYVTDGDQTSGDASLTWRKRITENGLSLVANTRMNLNDSDNRGELNSLTGIAGGGNVLTYEEIAQIQNSLGNTLNQTQRLSLSKSFPGNMLIDVRGERQVINEDKDQTVYDLVSGQQVVNDLLTNGLDRTYTYFKGGLNLRKNWEDFSFGIGAVIQESTLEGKIIENDVSVSNGYTHVLPNMNVRWAVGDGQNLFVRYAASTREPSMSELQPFTDNSDPLNIYVGNPSLEPEYRHDISTNYHYFDQFTFVNLFANLRASYTENKIARSRTVLDGLKQEITSINTDGDWTLSGNVNFGSPIRPVGMKFNVSVNSMYNKGIEFINAEENKTTTRRNTIKTTLENRDKDLFDLAVSASYTFNDVKYTLNERFNQNYINSSYEVRAAYYLGESLEFSTSLDLKMYSQDVFGEARNVPLWQASITKSMINQRADLQLLGLDLLDRNEGISFSNSGNFISEQRVNSLGRYVMLKFIYRLSGSGRDSGPKGMMIHMD